MKFNWFRKSTPTTDAILKRLSEESNTTSDLILSYTALTLNGLPTVVADDDLIEFLYEEGYDETIEYDDFLLLYAEWEAENVDTSETSDIEAYCVYCKESVNMTNGQIKVSDSGRRMAQGLCGHCGTKVNKILGRE